MVQLCPDRTHLHAQHGFWSHPSCGRLLNGVWWAHIGFWLNLFWRKRGIHHLLTEAVASTTTPAQAEKQAFETCALYLAVDIELTALIMAVVSWRLVHNGQSSMHLTETPDRTSSIKAPQDSLEEERLLHLADNGQVARAA